MNQKTNHPLAIFLSVSMTCAMLFSCSTTSKSSVNRTKFVMVIHGGAGVISKENMTPEREKAYTEKLSEALQAGYQRLQNGQSALDAVQAAINVMENSPLFNAGKGSVFTHDGTNSMDASVMEGKTLMAGAVADVTIIKNPIDAARAVMEKSQHVMLSGRGAELFAIENGIDTVPPSYFFTQERWNQLQRVLTKEAENKNSYNPVDPAKKNMAETSGSDEKFGTVGAVALDNDGNLAAGTSTGGMTNKRFGRIGDSPIIGAGTYCNNSTAGLSSTGWGEFYIREVAAKRVSDLMELKEMPLQQAMRQTIDEIEKMGGDGGMIGLTKDGQVAMEFNTSGMFRGTIDSDGNISVQIYQ